MRAEGTSRAGLMPRPMQEKAISGPVINGPIDVYYDKQLLQLGSEVFERTQNTSICVDKQAISIQSACARETSACLEILILLLFSLH